MVRCYTAEWYRETKQRIDTIREQLEQQRHRFLNTLPAQYYVLRINRRDRDRESISAFDYNMSLLAFCDNVLDGLFTKDAPSWEKERELDNIMQFIDRQLQGRISTSIWYVPETTNLIDLER